MTVSPIPPSTIPPKGGRLHGPSDDTGWHLFDGDVAFPAAVLLDSALRVNSASLMAFCAAHGAALAPHGKTTMSPELFRRQLADGAWAITAATVWQAQAMAAAGVPRILIANEVVTPAEIRWIAGTVEGDVEVLCYVDSPDGVAIFDDTLGAHHRSGDSEQIPVLVEVGITGGRGGARTLTGALAVAEAVHRSPVLRLAGVSGFEGILGPTAGRPAAEVVGEFLGDIVDAAIAIDERGWFHDAPEVIVSAGGSAYFDHVVTSFGQLELSQPTRVVLRSGCYLTHDHGALHDASPLGETPRVEGTPLQPAIEVWAAVLSRPEPTRVIVGAGRRDVSTDGSLPVMTKRRDRRTGSITAVAPRRAVQVNDQHAYFDVDADDPLAVGDLVCLGISHPCTTFDKWRVLPIVDDHYRVLELATTVF